MQQSIPLAERMRPTSLDTYIGQSQLLGVNSAFRIGLDKGLIPSMILWGPPGVGKTTRGEIGNGILTVVWTRRICIT